MNHTIAATAADLRKITLSRINLFSLNLSGVSSGEDFFHCEKILRCLPGKRISCIGNWRRRKVFAKFFFDAKKAHSHAQKETLGIELLAQKKIATPKLIWSDSPPPGDIVCLIFEFVENAENFKTRWLRAAPAERPELLNRLAILIAEHHNKGIIQNDLHLDNFIFKDDTLYTLDGSDILDYPPSDSKPFIENLALLFAQFTPENDANIKNAFSRYLSVRKPSTFKCTTEQIHILTRNKREYRKKKFLEKAIRNCSSFIANYSFTRFYVCDRRHFSDRMTALIENPDPYISEGRLIKKGNSSTVSLVTIDGTPLVVKRYNIKNWRHGLSRALRPSRAVHSWLNAQMMTFYGIKVPRPVAFIENRWGPFRNKAYYISLFLPSETCADYFANELHSNADKQIVAYKIVGILNAMKSLRIFHGDLKSSNILIHKGEPYLIDLDSMKQFSNEALFSKALEKDQARFRKNWSSDKLTEMIFRNISNPPDSHDIEIT